MTPWGGRRSPFSHRLHPHPLAGQAIGLGLAPRGRWLQMAQLHHRLRRAFGGQLPLARAIPPQA
jgi:hypothetical protein